MKPTKLYCQYCDLYPCKRKTCNRKAMWENNGPIYMAEPKQHNPLNLVLQKRLYKSSPLTKAERGTNF